MRSLKARLILNTILPVLIILPAMGILITYLLETQIFLGNLTNEMTKQAILVADAASAYVEIWQDPLRAQSFVTRISPRLTAKLMLLDPAGRLIVSSDPEDSFLVGQVFDVPDAELLLARDLPAEVTMDEQKIQDIIVPVITGNSQLLGFVRLANPLTSIYERSQTLREVMFYVLGGGLLLGLILSWLLARDVERPLHKTTLAAYRFASGEQLERIPEEGPRETRLLLRAFNTMVERLETMETSRKRLLANLVHELGRPLGALRSASQALLSGAGEDPQLRQDLLQGIDDELVRLQSLLNEVSHLHEKVLGPLDLRFQEIDPRDWLLRILPPWERLAHEKRLVWRVDLEDNLPRKIQIDPDRLAQAVENLISNAIRYTPPGGNININAGQKDDSFVISIHDNGIGIATEDIERIFEPYQRGLSSQRLPEGMGLGLSIARDLVIAHQGDLTVESVTGEGSLFSIRIPLDISDQ